MASTSATEDKRQADSSKWHLRLLTLIALCFTDGTYTVTRRYALGVRKEEFSFNEVLLLAEFYKVVFAVWMISRGLKAAEDGDANFVRGKSLSSHLIRLILRSRKMFVLAAIYGTSNVLSYVALRRVGAGTFVVIAQTKTLTTALFSYVMLRRRYSWTKWRALVLLVSGVVLFVMPTLEENSSSKMQPTTADTIAGCLAETVVVILSGFASVYFEAAVKSDSDACGIWEINFQLGLCSLPIYVSMATMYPNGKRRLFSDWTPLALMLSVLGAMGGLLVALSIKYGDSVLKTLAISGSIIYAAVVDHHLLGGPLTSQMIISALVTIIAILNYTFDATPDAAPAPAHDKKEPASPQRLHTENGGEKASNGKDVEDGWVDNESQPLVERGT